MKKIIACLLLAAMLLVALSSCAVDMEDMGSIQIKHTGRWYW